MLREVLLVQNADRDVEHVLLDHAAHEQILGALLLVGLVPDELQNEAEVVGQHLRGIVAAGEHQRVQQVYHQHLQFITRFKLQTRMLLKYVLKPISILLYKPEMRSRTRMQIIISQFIVLFSRT